ncbi:hypothetical protein SmJEL517_g01882 [Synchytrium microbalum]|uniref:Rab-GAP TBC domain-containing protein n=1 Tax=Synchytrium microbalum TaxID=1806994 RepID=A0A507C7X7_9FUNG|nr:uncharacterized protein SmJEL517_g01882 [Synchytrium microbalum]TPX35712.1 hypothetical protein SmJEL517_g01882 [Synchytrium microbalum]
MLRRARIRTLAAILLLLIGNSICHEEGDFSYLAYSYPNGNITLYACSMQECLKCTQIQQKSDPSCRTLYHAGLSCTTTYHQSNESFALPTGSTVTQLSANASLPPPPLYQECKNLDEGFRFFTFTIVDLLLFIASSSVIYWRRRLNFISTISEIKKQWGHHSEFGTVPGRVKLVIKSVHGTQHSHIGLRAGILGSAPGTSTSTEFKSRTNPQSSTSLPQIIESPVISTNPNSPLSIVTTPIAAAARVTGSSHPPESIVSVRTVPDSDTTTSNINSNPPTEPSHPTTELASSVSSPSLSRRVNSMGPASPLSDAATLSTAPSGGGTFDSLKRDGTLDALKKDGTGDTLKRDGLTRKSTESKSGTHAQPNGKEKTSDKLESSMMAEAAKLNSMAIRFQKFKAVLELPNIDLDQLRKLSWKGVPDEIRPMVWQLLMGYLPCNSDRRDATLARKRSEYAEYVEQSFAKGKDGLDQALYHQIHIDIQRTNSGVPLYQDERIREALERILYCWAIRHPASGYVQGINDLVTPFFQVFLAGDLSITAADVETCDVEKIPLQTIQNVEADSFWCLTKLLDGIQDNYTFAQPGIQRQITKLKELINRIDGPLALHLQLQGVEFIQFAFRWMNCLLMRELSIKNIIRMWDTYQAEGADGFSDFHLYVCASFLGMWSEQLRKMEFQDIMMFLQALPTSNWEEKDIELLLSQGFYWKSLFHDSPSHLQNTNTASPST